jgi:hypothetical protein
VKHKVTILEIAADARPGDSARPVGNFTVDSPTLEGARKKAIDELTARGRHLRALSFLEGGGLVAVVYAKNEAHHGTP